MPVERAGRYPPRAQAPGRDWIAARLGGPSLEHEGLYFGGPLNSLLLLGPRQGKDWFITSHITLGRDNCENLLFPRKPTKSPG